MSNTRRILILTADAGLGHRSAAKAIAAALGQKDDGDCDVKIVNPLADEDVPALLQGAQSDYDRIVRESPELYRAGYEIADTSAMASLLQAVVAAAVSDPLSDLIDSYDPHVVVSTYPSYQGLLDTDLIRVPYLVVVTDLTTIHHAWFHSKIDLCVVPTQAGREKALAAGVPSEHVEVIGIPVDPVFAEARDRDGLRRSLGWDSQKMTLLAVGGKRVSHLEAVLHAINHSGFPLHLAVVAGNNEELHERLKAVDWHLPVEVYGFVENMPDLMAASDAILCKAGGLIVSEALAAGLPLLLVDALPGQEVGNAEFVVEGDAGVQLTTDLDVLETLTHWLADAAARLAEVTGNARRLGNPGAAGQIADRIWDLAT